MNESDLHPEDLLDRARRDELSEAERERLQQHVATCSTCAMELALRRDFEEVVLDGPDQAAVLARITAGTMAQLDADAATREIDNGAATRAHRRRVSPGSARLLAAAAVLVIVVGGAAAATYVLPELLGGDDPGESKDRDQGEKQRPAAPVVAPDVEDQAVAEAEEEPLEMEPDLLPRARKPKRPAPAREAEEPSAAELLARANAARRRGENREAAALYRTLQEHHPKSREQRASRVALGRLLLDRLGEPEAALAQFEYYLARYGGGTLAEEARVGRALALGKVGRRSGERAAWQDLLEHHPSSPHARRAKQRIDELGGSR